MSVKNEFIPLEEALKYGHSEHTLNTKFERNTIRIQGAKYSKLELEYYKENGVYPSFPLDGWVRNLLIRKGIILPTFQLETMALQL